MTKTPREYAASLIAKREYSVQDLRQKLHVKYPENISLADAAIASLVSSGALSDERYANAMVRYLRLTTSGGPMQISLKLKRKGIAQDLIDVALAEEADDDTERLTTLATKKLAEYKRKKPMISDYELRGKVYQALARKGFSAGAISTVLGDLL